MSDSSFTLCSLFAFPEQSVTNLSPSNQWQEFQNRLGREIKIIEWRTAMPDLVSKLENCLTLNCPIY